MEGAALPRPVYHNGRGVLRHPVLPETPESDPGKGRAYGEEPRNADFPFEVADQPPLPVQYAELHQHTHRFEQGTGTQGDHSAVRHIPLRARLARRPDGQADPRTRFY